MRLFSSAACVAVALLSIAAAPATQPGAPAVQPVAVPVVAQHVVPTKIVIMPFPAMGDVVGRLWIGAAVQQSLSADVSRLGGMTVMSVVQGVNVADTNAVLQSAKSTGCDTVVSGTCQFAGDEMRITGQVMDVVSGKSIGGLKVSGDVRDLFSLEDELSSELRHLLRPAQNPAVAINDNGGMNPAEQPAAPADNGVNDNGVNYLPNYSPVYSYSNPNDYGYYGNGAYGYGYDYPGVVIIDNDRHHRWSGRSDDNGQPTTPVAAPIPAPAPPHGVINVHAAPIPVPVPLMNPQSNQNPGYGRFGSSVH
jgi:TolB-like protein